MKNILFIIIIILPLFSFAQKDTVYYFGVNGKIENPDQKQIKKLVDFKGKSKIHINTLKSTEEGWVKVYNEKIKVASDSIYEIRVRGDKFSGKVEREFQPLENGYFKFIDKTKNGVKRSGISKQKVPLILNGEVTEYYENGKKRSVSQYKNNELISNKNWQPDGTQIVDDIFYSVDSEPRFEPGMAFIHQQISEAIKKANFDLLTVQGQMIVGLVITKEGEIGGVRIIQGISQTLNGILVEAFGDIKGAWVPANLNGEDVNYLQMLPINFIASQYNFDSLEFTGGMLFWVIN